MKPTRTMLTGALLASTAIMMPGLAMAQTDGPTVTSDEVITVQGAFVPDEKRETSEISNILDAEALTRTQDSNVADALQRLTGLSLDDGRFVIVRGLNERYSKATLNGSVLPSNEPLRNVVPLDIFPTSILESVLVQKTYSPEFSADFGGGLLELRTVAVPDEEFFEIGASLGINTVTSFEEGLTYNGSDYDWTGIDDIDDFREFPSSAIPSDLSVLNATELEIAGESLPNVWSIQEDDSIPPDLSFSAAYGNGWSLGGERELGVILVADYGNSWFTKDGLRRDVVAGGEIEIDNSANAEGCDEIGRFECGFFETVQTIDLNALASVGFALDNDNSIKFTSMILRKTTKEALLETGVDREDDFVAQDARIDWIERQTWSNQVIGEHYFTLLPTDTFQDTIFTWRASYSEATRDVKNRKEFLYEFDELFGGFLLDRREALNNDTVYASLEDETWEVGADIRQPFDFYGYDVELKFGLSYQEQERLSTLRRFEFLPDGIVGLPSDELRAQIPEIIFGRVNIDPNGYVLSEFTQPSDSFEADSEIFGAYAGLDALITPTIRVAAGLRYEDSEQNQFSFARSPIFCADFAGSGVTPQTCRGDTPTVLAFDEGDAIVTTLTGEFLLPSVTATWEFLPNNQVRVGYSQTINRPSLRELSTSPFLDAERDVEVEGNPFLEIGEVDNFDIRWEWYFARNEFLTVGAFYKQIDNPIEETVFRVGNEYRRSFINGEEAELIGVEAEIQYGLQFQDWFGWDWLGARDFFIYANAAYIDSETTVPSGTILTNDSRELQGQSDILANLQFGFTDFDRGERAAILFNYTGERIDGVGVDGIDDQIETPPILLDFVYSRELPLFGGAYEFSFAARNLLNDEYELEQESVLIEQYDLGRTFSFGVKARY